MRNLLFKYTTATSRFLVIDSTLVHYRDEGEGEPILLLHGAFSSLHTFNAWTQILSTQYRVLRFDLLGFGLTGPTDSNDYSIPNHLRIIRTFLNMMGVERCHIAGNSLGGWFAWEFALRYPERVNKLVLIDAAGIMSEDNIPLPFKLARAPLMGKIIRYVVRRPVLEQFIRQVYFDASKVDEALVDRYYDLFTREGNTNAFVQFVNTNHKDNTHNLSRLKAPTLILWGKEDQWIPLKSAHFFNEHIPQSQLIIYPLVGHLPMEEIPVRTAQDLIGFLQKSEFHFPY